MNIFSYREWILLGDLLTVYNKFTSDAEPWVMDRAINFCTKPQFQAS